MPSPIETWLLALPWLLGAAALAWAWSVVIRNVTLVDTLWSLMFLLAAVVYAYATPPAEARTVLVLVLVALWSIRLAAYLGVRTLGHAEEDARYQAIRRRNEPGFAWKSLYLVFGMALVAMPLLAQSTPPPPVSPRTRTSVARKGAK